MDPVGPYMLTHSSLVFRPAPYIPIQRESTDFFTPLTLALSPMLRKGERGSYGVLKNQYLQVK